VFNPGPWRGCGVWTAKTLFSAIILPLSVMLLSTPSLSLTVPATSAPPSLAVFVAEPAGSHPQHEQSQQPASAPADPPPSTVAPARPTHSRRLTLSRFPLLRKGSRELGRSPSTHKGSGTTPPPPVHTPFLSTGAPRASTSTLRGPETSPARTPSAHGNEADSIQELEEGTLAASTLRQARPGKMHQTSSRLLRMTDDERPFTRVSEFSYPNRQNHPPCHAPEKGYSVKRKRTHKNRHKNRRRIKRHIILTYTESWTLDQDAGLKDPVATAIGFLYLDF
jgi:hypothetical protein